MYWSFLPALTFSIENFHLRIFAQRPQQFKCSKFSLHTFAALSPKNHHSRLSVFRVVAFAHSPGKLRYYVDGSPLDIVTSLILLIYIIQIKTENAVVECLVYQICKQRSELFSKASTTIYVNLAICLILTF